MLQSSPIVILLLPCCKWFFEISFLDFFSTFFMRLRLFFRGEKEYRAKRPRPHRVDTDGDTESEPEEKKIERRKKKFRLDIHDDQV